MILASHPERFATCGNLHLGVSDDDLVFAVGINKLAKPKAREIENRSMRQLKNDAFLQDLRNVPWDTAYIYDNVDDLCDHWATLYNEILDNHAPIKCGVISYRGLRQRYSVKSRGAIGYLKFTLELPLRPHGMSTENKETGSLHLEEV